MLSISEMKQRQAIAMLPLYWRRQRNRGNPSRQEAAVMEEAHNTGEPRWGHPARQQRPGEASRWTPAQAESWKRNGRCLGNDSKNMSGEEVALQKDGAVRERGSLAAPPSSLAQLPCTYYTFIFLSSPERLWFPTAMNKAPNAKQKWTGS